MNELRLELPDETVEAIARRAAELVLEHSGGAAASPWFSLSDAADYLQVSERTLEREIARGRLLSSTIGRRRLLHRDDLDGFARAAREE